jgi:hypothetical protein
MGEDEKKYPEIANMPMREDGRSALVQEARIVPLEMRKRGASNKAHYLHGGLGHAQNRSKKSSLVCSTTHRETIRF